jgi:hypothetical protein
MQQAVSTVEWALNLCTQNYWVFGLCPSSDILKPREQNVGARIAHSVYQLATGWTTEGSEFESPWCQEFSLLSVVQTGSGVHPTSYPLGTGDSFPGGKAAGA